MRRDHPGYVLGETGKQDLGCGPVVHKAKRVLGGDGGGAEAGAGAPEHQTESAGSAVVKLVVVERQGQLGAVRPGQEVCVCEILAEAAGSLVILVRTIESALQAHLSLFSFGLWQSHSVWPLRGSMFWAHRWAVDGR